MKGRVHIVTLLLERAWRDDMIYVLGGERKRNGGELVLRVLRFWLGSFEDINLN